MKKMALCIAALVAAFAIPSAGQTSWTIYSPDSAVQATVQLANLSGQAGYANSVRLYYSVRHGRGASAAEVVPASPLGIVRSDRNFVDGLAFVSEGVQRSVDSTYTMITGKRRVCRNYFNEKVLSFQTTTGNNRLDVIVRAYNDGFAFRYRFPETNSTQMTVTAEESGIRLPAGSTACIMPYDIYGTYQPGYENYWNNNIAVGTLVSGVTICGDGANGWAMPALFKTPTNHYALFFETDVTENFCGMHLREPSQNVYRLALPLQAEANNNGSVNPSWTLPWVMPWRVVAVSPTPAGILEQTLASDLATPSQIADVSWIKPGRASWSWWSNEDVTRYNNVTPFIDLAQQMGWEYSLVDVGWNQMTATGGGTWQNLVTYAAGKNVSLLFWYNSGGTNSTVNMQPRDRMSSQTTRRNEMNTIGTAGVKGIKVDFFHADKQWIMKYYLDILRDAAQYRLAVNFHGCTVPRGWQRTWPNLMSMESVRGAEYYKYDGGYPARQPARNTILPFTRNAVASMDYTPVTFTNMANAHATTYGHELALSVVFESGIQHFADRVSAYNATPANVRNFLAGVPVAWDNTRYLQGAPGTYLVLARQKGQHWYLCGINGQGSGQSVTVPFNFLVSGVRYQMLRIADGTSNTSFSELLDTVVSTESITVSMRANGGFVARLANIDAVAVAPDIATREISGRQASIVAATAGVLVLPPELAGMRLAVNLFDLNGKLVKSARVRHRRSVEPADFGCRPGVYIVKIVPIR